MNVANIIDKKYNLHVHFIEEINRGISNTKFRFKTQEGTFFLKKMRHESTKEIAEEISFVTYLYEHNIPLLLPLKTTEKEYYFSFENKVYILYPFVDFDTDITTKNNIFQIGKVLAKIHEVPINCFSARKNGWRTLIDIFQKECENEDVRKLLPDFYTLREIIQKGRRCIVHGDSWSTNYLFKRNELLYVSDWEGVDVWTTLQDLSISFMGQSYPKDIFTGTEADYSYFAEFLRGYESVRKLNVFEKAHLFEAALYGALFCTIYAYVLFNINKSKEHMDEFYKYKLIRYEKLKSLGKTNFYKNIEMT